MAEQTRIHLVRHGEVYNPDGVLYGDCPDSACRTREDGRRRRWRRRWPTVTSSRWISSPLQRAQQTAEPIAAAHDLPVDTDPDL
ncbi:histidine phosphatase family protein, partial [Mycolicibacterium vaccae]|nr:histidine phosphatase family protein [Mycolicibacterium vaccae]